MVCSFMNVRIFKLTTAFPWSKSLNKRKTDRWFKVCHAKFSKFQHKVIYILKRKYSQSGNDYLQGIGDYLFIQPRGFFNAHIDFFLSTDKETQSFPLLADVISKTDLVVRSGLTPSVHMCWNVLFPSFIIRDYFTAIFQHR
jgi:hypothetical protein